ncbi:hypothetical protein BH11ACT2_BH11ACT2_18710 [soil metagenome]
MIQIALTGGIAAGKSVVAKRLAELGAVVIDADALAREIVQPSTPGLAAVREAFETSMIATDGSLDRPALGHIVFADESKRRVLNDITHPAINARRRELIAQLPVDAVVVNDIPLLVETVPDPRPHYAEVVVVHADWDERIRRMVKNRGMSREEAEGRMRAQATEDERLAIATTVIDNTGALDDTIAQVDAFWAGLSR